MTYGQLFSALADSGLSPEAAAKRLGISNMSLRRWRSRPEDAALPEKYARAFRPVLGELAHGASRAAQAAAAQGQREDFQATLARLGFPKDILSGGAADQDAMLSGLAQVGADAARRQEVDRSQRRISTIARWGDAWKDRIGRLLEVVRSKEVMAADKLVAYGALFYLIAPFDLIPDAIPVIGYMDDFVVLGLAAWYYKNRAARRRAAKV